MCISIAYLIPIIIAYFGSIILLAVFAYIRGWQKGLLQARQEMSDG